MSHDSNPDSSTAESAACRSLSGSQEPMHYPFASHQPPEAGTQKVGRLRCAHAAPWTEVYIQPCLHQLRTAGHDQGSAHLQGCFHSGQRVGRPAAQGAQALLHKRAGSRLRQCPSRLAPARARPVAQQNWSPSALPGFSVTSTSPVELSYRLASSHACPGTIACWI